jgi:hypothetical protein
MSEEKSKIFDHDSTINFIAVDLKKKHVELRIDDIDMKLEDMPEEVLSGIMGKISLEIIKWVMIQNSNESSIDTDHK